MNKLENFLKEKTKLSRIEDNSKLEENIHIMKFTDVEEFLKLLNTMMFVEIRVLYCSGVETLVSFSDLKYCVPEETLNTIRKAFDDIEIKKKNRKVGV